MLGLDHILLAIRQMHDQIRQVVLEATTSRSSTELSKVVANEGGDIVFALDRVAEHQLMEFMKMELSTREPIVLVAEGLSGGQIVLPAGARQSDCRWRIIIDPIDGTRPLMFQKRSAWILSAVAPNRGPATNLQNITLAVQTEIPLVKQHLSDQVWAERGKEVQALRYNRLTKQNEPLRLHPSRAETVQFGYASISRFFPGLRDVSASIDDEVIRGALGPQPPGGTLSFEDQYPSTGGQLYSLFSGADRFLADLRPLLAGIASERGETLGHCCHPYDICTSLIAQQLGAIITAPSGQPLDVPLDVETDVAWVGYANHAIRRQVEPVLQAALRRRGFID